MPVPPSESRPAAKPAAGIRARVRAEMTAEIKRLAREHLAKDGPNLSLRAVARELGVVSSAVYRYFPSRDALLTTLIIEGYDSLGETVERHERAVARADLAGRWLAIGRAVRAWSLRRPHEYALLYGSPVPGYAAPADTVGPAGRPLLVFAGVLRDAVAAGVTFEPEVLPAPVRADLERIASDADYGGLPAHVMSRGLIVWTELFGALSFELFGRLTNGITDNDAWFDHQLRAMADYLGLP